MFKLFTATLLTASLLASCGGDDLVSGTTSPTQPSDSTTTTTTPDQSVGGFGSPSRVDGEFPFGSGLSTSGVLQRETNGCWYVEFDASTHLAVFPLGFEIPFVVDTSVIVGPDGETYSHQTPIDGVVHEVPVYDLPGGGDGKWGNYVAFCKPSEISIAVFDSMEVAFDTSALSVSEVEQMVVDAVFSKSWACGRGWAISTDDERVGIWLYQMSSEQLDQGAVVTLPDEAWLTRVSVGKHLFSGHCDDTSEPWEPIAVIAGQWELAAGTLRVQDSFPRDPASAGVRAELAGAAIETDTGSLITVPPLQLFNRSFNFFAG